MSIKTLIRRILTWATTEDKKESVSVSSNEYYMSNPISLSKYTGSQKLSDYSFGTNFVLFNANGGKVVQVTSYNPTTDRSSTSLYIVPDNADLGNEIGQIITRECLTR